MNADAETLRNTLSLVFLQNYDFLFRRDAFLHKQPFLHIDGAGVVL